VLLGPAACFQHEPSIFATMMMMVPRHVAAIDAHTLGARLLLYYLNNCGLE
jgi:hypothetical protein